MTTCWCGKQYVRGVCPLHGAMDNPSSQGQSSYYNTYVTEHITENVAELPLSYAQNALTSNVTLSASNSFYQGPIIAISQGLWLVNFHVVFSRSTTTAVTYYARIFDGVNTLASGQQYQQSVANHFVQMSMSCIYSGGPGYLTGQGATSSGSSGSEMRYQLSQAGFGQRATMISAVKIG